MLKRTLSSRRFFFTPKLYVFAYIKEKSPAQKAHTSDHQSPASDMPYQWPIAGGPLMARRCVLAWWRPYDSRAIKRRQYFVSKYGSSIISIVVIDVVTCI